MNESDASEDFLTKTAGQRFKTILADPPLAIPEPHRQGCARAPATQPLRDHDPG